MRPVFVFRKRFFLDSIATSHTSHILAEVESSQNGEYQWGHYMLTLADCRRRIQWEFFLGTKQARRNSVRKINLLINLLVRFRDALQKEIDLIEKAGQSGPKKSPKRV